MSNYIKILLIILVALVTNSCHLEAVEDFITVEETSVNEKDLRQQEEAEKEATCKSNGDCNDLIAKAQRLLDNVPALMSTEEVLKKYEEDFAKTFKDLGGNKNKVVARTFDEVKEKGVLGRREHTTIVNSAKQILEITKTSQFSVDESDPNNQKLVAEIALKVRIYSEHGEEIVSIDDHILKEKYVNDLADALTEKKTKGVDLIFASLLGFNPAVGLMYKAISKYYDIEKERLRKENPTWSKSELAAEALLSVTQSGLDVAGMVPVVGEVADGLNGTIYLVRGDVTNAGISFAALLPVGGQAATGTRLAVKVAKGVESIAAPIAKNAGEVQKLVDFTKMADKTIDGLKPGAKIIEEGTGSFRKVKGHHPMAKKAFEGANGYNPRDAFSVSKKALDKFDVAHGTITGKQNSLYTAWKKANPGKSMSVEDMAKIEVQAMKNAGIPEDVAKGWVKKGVEDLKRQGTSEIKNIPWNGVNPK